MGSRTSVPAAVVVLLQGAQDIGAEEQAFPFLTVDDAGFPHAALLSRSELDVGDAEEILAVIASPRTRANLDRAGRATLIAVEGTTAHSLKLRVIRALVDEGLLGVALEVVEHKADSVGVPLQPIAYRTTAELAEAEHWDRSARVLSKLR